MGYEIQYGQTMVKMYVPERKKFLLTRKNGGILITGIVILLALYFCNWREAWDFLIPGNSKVTRAAASKMVTNLKDGEPISASFEAFCREIINGANIPE